MSDINLDFTVSNNSIDFTVQPNELTITPTDIQLSVYTSGAPIARGANTQVQYNNDGILDGANSFTYNNITNIVNATNFVSSNANITNGTVNVSSLTSAYSNLGNVANVKIGGGTNGYVLQTDGTGNLNWTAMGGGGGGNGTPGGSNTQIQYNDNGAFGGNAGFTFNEVTGDVNLPGNLTIIGTFSGNVANANYANFAGTAFNVSGSNVTGAVAYATTANSVAGANVSGAVTYATTANNVAGANVSGAVAYATVANSVAGSNVSGQVANALIASTVYTNAQPNITSVGTLTSVSVSGNISTTGTTSIQQAKEKVTVSATPAASTVNFDILTQAILLNTANATANFVLNIRGNSSVTLDTVMNSNESVTLTFVNPNGANAYYATSISVDGSTRTVNWVQPAGIPTGGTVGGKDVYNLNLIKTASNTYTIFGTKLGYS